jgi:hypothetical protein
MANVAEKCSLCMLSRHAVHLANEITITQFFSVYLVFQVNLIFHYYYPIQVNSGNCSQCQNYKKKKLFISVFNAKNFMKIEYGMTYKIEYGMTYKIIMKN